MYEEMRGKSADSNKTEESIGTEDTDEELTPATKKPEAKKWVHVDRALREETFKHLSTQKRMILISQCSKCRAERDHAISVPYGADYLIVINNCRGCLETNIDIGKVYMKYWPKVEDRTVERVTHSKEGFFVR